MIEPAEATPRRLARSVYRIWTYRPPVVPASFFANSRSVGCFSSMQNCGETTTPPGLMVRDLLCDVPAAKYFSLPETRLLPLSSHDGAPPSKSPPGATE